MTNEDCVDEWEDSPVSSASAVIRKVSRNADGVYDVTRALFRSLLFCFTRHLSFAFVWPRFLSSPSHIIHIIARSHKCIRVLPLITSFQHSRLCYSPYLRIFVLFPPPCPQTLFLSPFHPNPKFSLLSSSFRSTTISPSFYCSIIHLSSLFFLIYHSFTISSKRERKMASRTSNFFSARHESFFVVKLRK